MIPLSVVGEIRSRENSFQSTPDSFNYELTRAESARWLNRWNPFFSPISENEINLRVQSIYKLIHADEMQTSNEIYTFLVFLESDWKTKSQ